MTFTDSNEDYRHWTDTAPPPSASDWINGALNDGAADYAEGEVVPHWFRTRNDNGTYAFNIYYDYLDGARCGFQELATYNESRSQRWSPTVQLHRSTTRLLGRGPSLRECRHHERERPLRCH